MLGSVTPILQPRRKRTKRITVVTLVTVLATLSGCLTTKQQTGQVAGGLLGGAAGYGVSRLVGGKTTGQVLGTAAGAAIGVWLGGQIGRELDERDRLAAQQATVQVLNSPTPKSVGQSSAPPKTEPAVAKDESPPALKPVDSAPKRTWKSDRTPDVNGSSQVVAVGTGSDGKECKRVREVAYIRGKEVQQETVYCRSDGGGGWVVHA